MSFLIFFRDRLHYQGDIYRVKISKDDVSDSFEAVKKAYKTCDSIRKSVMARTLRSCPQDNLNAKEIVQMVVFGISDPNLISEEIYEYHKQDFLKFLIDKVPKYKRFTPDALHDYLGNKELLCCLL